MNTLKALTLSFAVALVPMTAFAEDTAEPVTVEATSYELTTTRTQENGRMSTAERQARHTAHLLSLRERVWAQRGY
jgi:hypothetical protein